MGRGARAMELDEGFPLINYFLFIFMMTSIARN
jgi:hypothetical protein